MAITTALRMAILVPLILVRAMAILAERMAISAAACISRSATAMARMMSIIMMVLMPASRVLRNTRPLRRHINPRQMAAGGRPGPNPRHRINRRRRSIRMAGIP
jgi:hypothetical protein